MPVAHRVPPGVVVLEQSLLRVAVLGEADLPLLVLGAFRVPALAHPLEQLLERGLLGRRLVPERDAGQRNEAGSETEREEPPHRATFAACMGRRSMSGAACLRAIMSPCRMALL